MSTAPPPRARSLTKYPDLVAQWHPTKNGVVSPEQVFAGSSRRCWWKCPAGPDHEWRTTVNNRTSAGMGCPCCSGRKLSVTNSLAALHLDIAAQWHPTKNGAVTAKQVVAGSHKKCWWQCPEGCDHEWEAMVITRTGGGKGRPSANGLAGTCRRKPYQAAS